ncbi:MAG: SGNH/GDSL hydrolase family protein [Elusimicrobiota bacterium]
MRPFALILALAAPLFAAPAPDLVVALGDSTTAGTPAFRSPLEAPPDGLGDVQSQYAYWLMRADPLRRVLNRGINGERADQIRARFARDVEAEHPRFVVILAGVNDVYQERPLADAEADLLWMYRRAKALGIVPVAATVLPFTRATDDQSRRIQELNGWIRSAAVKERIPFCDTARAAADPKNLRRLKGSPDGFHPDVGGYRAVGEALSKALKDER